MSFVKFNPFNLSITYNIENHFLDENLIYTKDYIEIYLKGYFKYIRTGVIEQNLIDYIHTLDTTHKDKLIHQLSSVIHEKKHFHDYMLSSTGNYIIRRYFYLYANTLAVMAEIKNNNYSSITTPIHRMVHFNSDLSEGFKFFIDKKNEAFKSIKVLNDFPNIDIYGSFSSDHIAREISGVGIFEAGAVLSQFSLIEDLFGHEYGLMDFQLDYFKKEFPHYMNVISNIQGALNLISSDKKDYILHNNTTINIILFISLNGNTENKKYVNNLEEPALRLMAILGLLVQEKCNVYDYKDLELFEYIENLLEKNKIISCQNALLENVSLNQSQYKLIKNIVDSNYQGVNPYSEPLLKAYKAFMEFNESMLKSFLDNPINYLSPLKYNKNFQNKFPVQNILEFDSGTFIQALLANNVLDINELESLVFDKEDNKVWSLRFKTDDSNYLTDLAPLYLEYSPLFFTLTEGQKAKFNIINPKLFDVVMNLIKKQFKVEEAFPIPKEEIFRNRMNKFWKQKKISTVKCDLCYSKIIKPKGYFVSGDELFRNSKFDKFVSKDTMFYKENYSMFCICDDCFQV